jgi:hypothetical protein
VGRKKRAYEYQAARLRRHARHADVASKTPARAPPT